MKVNKLENKFAAVNSVFILSERLFKSHKLLTFDRNFNIILYVCETSCVHIQPKKIICDCMSLYVMAIFLYIK